MIRPLASAFALAWALHAASTVEAPFPGITHITRTETSPREITMHIVKVDLAAPGISFKVTPPGGTRETVRQTTLDFLKQEKAQVAINAHFFLPFPSTDSEAFVIGMAASNGTVYSACEVPAQSYALVANTPALNIDASNRASIVSCSADPRTLWNTVSGSAQIVTNGTRTIPTYTNGLLTAGGPSNYSDTNSWYEAANARTAIGITRDSRTLVLFTVDRAAGSRGMKVGEVADLLIADYGVHNALNLDGGGSTTLAMENPVTHQGTIVNASSDNPNGRPVATSLAVFAR